MAMQWISSLPITLRGTELLGCDGPTFLFTIRGSIAWGRSEMSPFQRQVEPWWNHMGMRSLEGLTEKASGREGVLQVFENRLPFFADNDSNHVEATEERGASGSQVGRKRSAKKE